MSDWIYALAVKLSKALLPLLAIGRPKIQAMLDGRKASLAALRKLPKPSSPRLWMHCASLGEYEQGRAVLLRIKQSRPDTETIVSFYSPSGYQHVDDPELIDHTFYLPHDDLQAMRELVKCISPSCFVLVKYEIWPHMLRALAEAKTPTVLIAATFGPNHAIHRWYGSPMRRAIQRIAQIYVQTPADAASLGKLDIASAVAGDTRLVSALDRRATPQAFDKITALQQRYQKTIIYASIWPDDLPLFKKYISDHQEHLHILVPHDVSPSAVASWQKTFSKSEVIREASSSNQLLINTIGQLKHLYRIADAVYVGGGMKTGLHNTLEPAVWHCPMLIGKEYDKFPEAVAFVQRGLAISVANADSFRQAMDQQIARPVDDVAKAYETYFSEATGGMDEIMKYICTQVDKKQV